MPRERRSRESSQRPFPLHPVRANRFVAFAVHPCPLASSVQGVIVWVVTPDQAEGPQYHVLPKDDAEAAVNILRAAGGLPPLYDEHDDEGG